MVSCLHRKCSQSRLQILPPMMQHDINMSMYVLHINDITEMVKGYDGTCYSACLRCEYKIIYIYKSSILYSIIYIIVCSNIFKYSEAVLSLASEASVRSWKMRSSDVWKLRPEASGETTIETSEASQEEAGEVPAICQHPTTVIPYPSISKPEKGDPNISKMTWSNKADPLLVDSVHGNRWDMDMGTVSSCISPKLVCTCLREHIKD